METREFGKLITNTLEEKKDEIKPYYSYKAIQTQRLKKEFSHLAQKLKI